jgi:hypothetical protein
MDPFPHDHGEHIQAYLHCAQCLAACPPDEAPRDYARLAVGWTSWGLQVWCVRHGANVCHVDFQGARHPADTHCSPTPRQDEALRATMHELAILARRVAAGDLTEGAAADQVAECCTRHGPSTVGALDTYYGSQLRDVLQAPRTVTGSKDGVAALADLIAQLDRRRNEEQD